MSLPISSESDLTLEVVILLILGVFMLLFGPLLFFIHTGDLPYTPDSMYGLLLVIASIQIITMGKTPFGDLRRCPVVIILGMCTAILGMLACFIPGYLTDIVRIVVGVLLSLGGISLLFQLFVSEKKAKKWIRIPGMLRQLIVACALSYLCTTIAGLLTLIPGIVTNPQTELFLLIYGMSFFYLAWCIQNVNRRYPKAVAGESGGGIVSDANRSDTKSRLFAKSSLPLSHAILILLGVLLVVLGTLLFPVSLGLLPFAPDGQLGLLLVVIALQMMALGNTPLGQFKRSWVMVLIGIGCASMGIISCIVPGILTFALRYLLGGLSIGGRVVFFATKFLVAVRAIKNPPPDMVPFLPVFRNMLAIQTVFNVVSLAFGLAILLPGLVPGFVTAGIVVIKGVLLLLLVSILQKMS